MNIKNLFTIALLAVCFSLSAQKIKDKATSVGESKEIAGVINPLAKEQTYKLILNDKLTYWDKSMKTGGFWASLRPYPSDVKAKKVKDNEPSDYTFTIVTSGMQFEGYEKPQTYKSSGKVVKFNYTFPCELQVKDKDGNLVKTFVINDGDVPASMIYHPLFLAEQDQKANSPLILPTSGFTQADNAIIDNIEKNKNAILTRIEYNTYYSYVETASKIITCGYGNPKFMYKPYIIALDQKNKTDLPELDAAIEKFSKEVIEVFSTAYSSDLQNRLLNSASYFESQYNKDSDKNLIKICAFDAGLAYLLSGDTERGYLHFSNADKELGIFSAAAGSFYDLFPGFAMINQLRSTDNPLLLTQALSVTERKQKEEEAKAMAQSAEAQAKLAAYLAPNIDNKEGYIINKKGERMEGTISLTYIQDPRNGIVDLDLGTVVYFKNKEGKEWILRPKDVDYMMVGDKRYESVKEKESAGLKVLGAVASGRFTSTYFMEKVYQKGNYIAYLNPMYGYDSKYYLIKKAGDEEAISFYTLLGNSKTAKEFIGDCTAISEKTQKKEIDKTEEGLKQFMDILSTCK